MSILKTGKMSTLMKIEPLILETSISDFVFHVVLARVHREKKERNGMFLLEAVIEFELFIAEYFQN